MTTSPGTSAPKCVIGIDPSMSRTGIAVLAEDRKPILDSIGTKGHRNDSLQLRYRRLDKIAAHILKTLLREQPALVMIEGPSYGSRDGSAHDRSGLWWRIVSNAIERLAPIAVVPPTCRMKYATGKGRADKDTVLAATIKRYPQISITNNDEADALVMAAMGMRHLKVPIEDRLPSINQTALDKIEWPA